MTLRGRAAGPFVLAVLCACLVSLPSARSADKAAWVDPLVRYFDTIVFGAEFAEGKASAVVAKWDGDVSLRVRNLKADDVKAVLIEHLKTLAELTKIRFDVFGGAKHKDRKADIDVLFMNKEEARSWTMEGPGLTPEFIEKLKWSAPCFFFSWQDPPGRLIRAVVVINVQQPDAAIRHCMLEELTQVLGLPNDSDDLRPSIFSDSDRLTELSAVDKVLLKTLYDPRLKAGTPRKEALAQAKEIIAEFLRLSAD